jgi:hypothetical protein
MPVNAGINNDDNANVENIAPNSGKLHPFAFKQ